MSRHPTQNPTHILTRVGHAEGESQQMKNLMPVAHFNKYS